MHIPMETVKATGTAKSLPYRNISLRQPQDLNPVSGRALDIIRTLSGTSDRDVMRLTSKILLVASGMEHFPRTTSYTISSVFQISMNKTFENTQYFRQFLQIANTIHIYYF